ncbi:LacI family DNA-binding transcriptional regulator [Shewanella baltica]|uniref:LacI family DNA-binding transcriptional regulator n=1 Tax=Shewanella baltica TaxID=62322 RepID=UPI0001530B39|nr:LacI family DNA-binding transcriptional regulator [Shewanella baltica]ACK47446.1 transcriptional regulator, LacI family [Shewanella baltica OS223]MCS6211124.1 LacI family transcriptional regulator [Shewanella baltica]
MQKKAMTLSDLAKIVGVSESTVSRALNNSSLISEKTRLNIQAKAKEYDFKINTTARSLRLQKSNTIAVVLLIGSQEDQSVSDPFILSILGVIADELTSRGYDMLLGTHRGSGSDWLAHYFDSQKADGVIVFGQGDNEAEFEKQLTSSKPVVVWGGPSPTQSYVTVGTDCVLGGKLATEHLLQQGCRNIAFVGHMSYEISLRYQGYCLAMAEAGLTPRAAIDAHFTYKGGFEAAQALLVEGTSRFDGIFAASDGIALGMICAFTEHKLKIPEDIAIVGYDDISVAAFMQPALSTIRQDTQQGGIQLVDTLFKLIHKEKTTSTLLETKLLVRDSSLKQP